MKCTGMCEKAREVVPGNSGYHLNESDMAAAHLLGTQHGNAASTFLFMNEKEWFASLIQVEAVGGSKCETMCLWRASGMIMSNIPISPIGNFVSSCSADLKAHSLAVSNWETI